MRICLSIQDEPDEEMTLTQHFGESSRFVIFDTQRDTFQPHACDPLLCRGVCHCYLPALTQRPFDAVICRSIGARAFAMLRRKQIEVFLTQESHVGKALQICEADKLPIAASGVCRPEIVALRQNRRRRGER